MVEEQDNTQENEENEDQQTIKEVSFEFGTQANGANAVETMQLPLRLLVVGDFTPESPRPDWSGASQLIRVDKDNFSAVMQRLNPRLSLEVPNQLSEEPRELVLDLQFPDIKAFHPEGVAAQVDVLARLMKIRQLTGQLDRREIERAEFETQLTQIGLDATWINRIRQALETAEQRATQTQPTATQTTTSESDTKESSLDSLWNMVDAGDRTTSKRPSRATSAVDRFARSVVQSTGRRRQRDRSVTQSLVDDIDDALGRQMNVILHHEKFQRLEATWRSLKFLVDRTDFRENIIVELLAVDKEALQEAVHHQVFTPEYNDLSEVPLSVIVADYEFNRSAVDMELLGALADMTAGMQVPFIASAGTAFFGVQSTEELARLPGLHSYLQKPEYTQWRSLRDKETSRYVALTVPQFLLRAPYGINGETVKAFQFFEEINSSSDHLWGTGAFAVGTTLVRSFAQKGWAIGITGRHAGGLVENLPLWTSRVAGRDTQIPLGVLLSQSKALEFAEAGFLVLSCQMNDDAAFVLSAPTIHRPETYSTDEATRDARLHVTLPYQLFATHLAHYVLRVTQDISTGLTPENIQTLLTTQFSTILGAKGMTSPEDIVTVEVSENEDNPAYYDVVLRFQPPFQILGRTVDLFLGASLHR